MFFFLFLSCNSSNRKSSKNAFKWKMVFPAICYALVTRHDSNIYTHTHTHTVGSKIRKISLNIGSAHFPYNNIIYVNKTTRFGSKFLHLIGNYCYTNIYYNLYYMVYLLNK